MQLFHLNQVFEREIPLGNILYEDEIKAEWNELYVSQGRKVSDHDDKTSPN